MTEPIPFREYPSPFDDAEGQSLPTCEPDLDPKPKPWLLPAYMFDDPEYDPEPQQNKTEHTPDSNTDEKPADHDQ